jgi:predicted DNA-binding protein (UPF0278 family)
VKTIPILFTVPDETDPDRLLHDIAHASVNTIPRGSTISLSSGRAYEIVEKVVYRLNKGAVINMSRVWRAANPGRWK